MSQCVNWYCQYIPHPLPLRQTLDHLTSCLAQGVVYLMRSKASGYSMAPKCMTTFNVFTYFWHKTLAAKRTHSSVERTPGTVSLCPYIAQSSLIYAGMHTFGSKLLMPKVYEYTESAWSYVWASTHYKSDIYYYTCSYALVYICILLISSTDIYYLGISIFLPK
jgi:hypothetical protein